MDKKNICFYIVVSFLFWLHGTRMNSQVPNSDYKLMYEEEFNDNILNEKEWYYRDSDSLIRGGYSQKENVSVETVDGIGYLRIDYNQWDVNNDSQDDVVGGGIMTKEALGYGYYEAKIKFYDETKGFHQSFWTLGLRAWDSYSEEFKYIQDAKNDLVPWVNSTLEIDAIELDSDYNHGGANFHWHAPTFETPGVGHHFNASYIDKTKWIVIGFSWEPGLIKYYIDGVQVHDVVYEDDRYAPQQVWLTGLANNQSFFGGGGVPNPGACMKVDYFRYYSKPEDINLIGNSSFELNGQSSEVPYNWIQKDDIMDNLYSDQIKVVYDSVNGESHAGSAHLLVDFQGSSQKEISNKQELKHIPNGTYRLSAWVQSSGDLEKAEMKISEIGGVEKSISIPFSNTWKEIVIDDVFVTNNNAEISFDITGVNGQWVKIDSVSFVDTWNNKDTTEIIIDVFGNGYSESSNTWSKSSLLGYNDSITRYSSKTEFSQAEWRPSISESGSYSVFVYKVFHENTDSETKLTINHMDGVDDLTVDYSSGASGWYDLGDYNFAIGEEGYVQIDNGGEGIIRSNAVKFRSNFTLKNEEYFVKENNEINIVPNPVKDIFELRFKAKTTMMCNLYILSTNGSLIMTDTINVKAGNNIIKKNISDFPKGVYMLVVRNGEDVFTSKILKL